jgi:hypothetical protein
LKATAQGTPFSAAFSSANSSAQLSCMRWSRDILLQEQQQQQEVFGGTEAHMVIQAIIYSWQD